MKKLNCILLIDDDEPTNFLNEMIISQLNCTESIVAVQSGREALDYLGSQVDGQFPQPDLILLDINMPGMNGWEFLVKYKNLDESQKGKVIIMMLTTSLNPDDEAKAHGIKDIKSFMRKPLTKEAFIDVLDRYFLD
ncbi:MAG: response regulator [Reichenbachiella sp.]|uniref:response regulator n=1 Tax=Reichenbachiella sp. TaxID=2184521 RepID=UPI0029675FBB|nr:response regulator [Reichenbachiella sp.]MDW3209783.1 response regulator [Reichenbachiella sp.]